MASKTGYSEQKFNFAGHLFLADEVGGLPEMRSLRATVTK